MQQDLNPLLCQLLVQSIAKVAFIMISANWEAILHIQRERFFIIS